MEQKTFPDIFTKLEDYKQEVAVAKHAPAVKEFWKQITPDVYECRITGRKLSKLAFRIYQDRSGCGPMGFVVEVF
jgi:hypothetical protein